MTAPTSADATTWRFRRLAALYPSRWRAAHGDAYVGTMLDVADAHGRSRPVAREWLSALRHAATVWAAEVGRVARTDATRRLSVAGQAAIVSGAALSLLTLVLGEWAPVRLLPVAPPAWWSRVPLERTTGVALFALWLVVLVLVAAGRTALARRLLVVATAVPSMLYLLGAAGGPGRPPAGVLLALTVFAAVAATAPDPSRRRRLALPALAVVAAAAAGAWLVVSWSLSPIRSETMPPLGFSFYRGGGLPLLAVPTIFAVLAALAGSLLVVRRRPEILVTAGLVGGGWLWLALSTRRYGLRTLLFPSGGAIELAVLLAPGLFAVVGALVVLSGRLRGSAARTG